MHIIAITEDRSMPGNFDTTAPGRSRHRPFVYRDFGEEAAAARGLELALRCGGPYHIAAPAKVLAHIPAELRTRAA
jgi:hypothetical protein